MKRPRDDFFTHWIIWIACIQFIRYKPVLGLGMVLCMLSLYLGCRLNFLSKSFRNITNDIADYIENCNELNEHIENLRATYEATARRDYGEASYRNISRFNYRKKKLNSFVYSPNVYDCSRSVCDNARRQPFKYVCKYFDIKADDETLEEFEGILNNFLAADEGAVLLQQEKEDILYDIDREIPWIIKQLMPRRLESELGFEEYVFNELYYPVFTFRYISAGGNSGTQYDVVMDTEMLERFIAYLSDSIKRRKSIAGQRRLMTPKLRQYIINRDDYTCRYCGNSSYEEPNLLLEVDHIIPLARGGITEISNLQTLCWKCNRQKGAKQYA